VTILLVEQRVAEALDRSDHGYVLETGHIVLEGRYEALLADDRVRLSYLGLTEAEIITSSPTREMTGHDDA